MHTNNPAPLPVVRILNTIDDSAIDQATEILAGVSYEELADLREDNDPTHEAWTEASVRLDQAHEIVLDALAEGVKVVVHAEDGYTSATLRMVNAMCEALESGTIYGHYPDRSTLAQTLPLLTSALVLAIAEVEAEEADAAATEAMAAEYDLEDTPEVFWDWDGDR